VNGCAALLPLLGAGAGSTMHAGLSQLRRRVRICEIRSHCCWHRGGKKASGHQRLAGALLLVT
jgi:hypothetical protein